MKVQQDACAHYKNMPEVAREVFYEGIEWFLENPNLVDKLVGETLELGADETAHFIYTSNVNTFVAKDRTRLLVIGSIWRYDIFGVMVKIPLVSTGILMPAIFKGDCYLVTGGDFVRAVTPELLASI